MSVYDYAEQSQNNIKKFTNASNPKLHIHNYKSSHKLGSTTSNHNDPKLARRSEAKYSVEFDYKPIVKNEVEKIQQFQDTVELLESNKSMQSLAHEIHL